VRVALVLHRKTPYADTVDLVDAGRELVAPRDVIVRAGREDFDGGVPGQAFRDVAGVEFRAAVDGLAVSLDGDCDLH
jgi:hypothetical protein